MEIAFRQEFGLRSDLAFVHQVRADASATSPGEDVYPVPLTPVERADMDRRREVEAQLGPAQAYAEQHAASFGGMYIDQAAGGVLVYSFTKETSRHETALLDRIPAGSQLRVRLVQNSESELNALLDAIVKDAQLLADEHGIHTPSIWTDIPANRVAVGIHPYSAGHEALLVERYGKASIRVYGASEGHATGCTNRDNCPGPPLRGGIRLNPYGCTSGFIAHAGSTYGYVLLTAGHCLAPYAMGTLWTHNTTTVGPQRRHSWAQNTASDGGYIDFSGSTNVSAWVYRSASAVDRVRARQAIGGTGDYVGGYVCQSGRISGISCGTIKSTNAAPTLSGVKLVRQRYASYYTKSGDSGAAVWSPYAEDMVTAYGIQSGVLDTQPPGQPGHGVQELNLYEWAVYSQIREVENALGVTVYTICC